MEIQREFFWTVLILWPGIVMGLLLSVALVCRREGNRLVNGLMALFLLGMAGRSAVFLWTRSGLETLTLLPDLFISLNWGYGPLFYFFVRAYIERHFSLSWMHLWHLLPIPVAMGVRWYFWSTGNRLRVIEMLEQHTLPPLELQIVGSLMLLTFVSYLFLGFRRIILYNNHIRDMASFTDTLHLRWLSFLAGVMLLPVVSAVASLLATGSPRIAPYVAGAISMMIGIIGLAAWINPAILNGIPPRLMLEQAEDLEPTRYSSSSLSPEQKERYLTLLTTHMETHRPWLNQEFTLSDLADQLDINAKYLSQVINERLDQHFMEFVNGYRTRYAQELLLHPAYQHYTVQAIGHEVGFRSRSAFYDAFREATGRTPAAWRAQAQSASLS